MSPHLYTNFCLVFHTFLGNRAFSASLLSRKSKRQHLSNITRLLGCDVVVSGQTSSHDNCLNYFWLLHLRPSDDFRHFISAVRKTVSHLGEWNEQKCFVVGSDNFGRFLENHRMSKRNELFELLHIYRLTITENPSWGVLAMWEW